MNKPAGKLGSVTDFFGVIEPFHDFYLTKYSSLLGAVEIAGQDPDGLDRADHAALAGIAQAIYGKLHRNVVVTQYYAHFDGVRAELRDRADPRSHHLSKRREQFLNRNNLSGSRLVHYIEIEPEEDLNHLKLTQLLKHVGLAAFEKHSRAIVRNRFSNHGAFLLQLSELQRMEALLQDTLAEIVAKWGGLFTARRLHRQEVWAHLRFLASLNPEMLQLGLREAIPDEDLDIYVTAGDVANLQVSGMDVLKLPGVANRYARVASVRRFTSAGGKMKPGLWAADLKSPVRVEGNYLLMTRWKPLTEFQRSLMFTKKNLDLERAQLSVFDMLKGGENRSELERQAGMKPRIKKQMEELGVAEGLPALWGTGDGYVVAFNEKPSELRQTALELNRAAGNANINLIWETVEIDRAFAALQPGQRRASNRELYLTSAQFGAASLVHQSSAGQPVVADMGNEEAQYLFTSKDGSLFHYSPFVGGRAMVIGVGPIRSGKTFAKNTTASHFMKYGGIYRAVDIDPGSELIAQAFGEGKGIFRVSNENGRGFNPFVSYCGAGDYAFRVHFTELMLETLKANDALEDQRLTPEEQQKFDDALEQTLALSDRRLQTLSHFVSHLPENMRRKFARWVRARSGDMTASNGRYAQLLDAQVDSIGELTSRIGVFNLGELRDDKKAMRPVLMETLYRITRAFEDPQNRQLPKELDIDEAHYALQIPQFSDYLVAKVRTWGKWFGSVHLWSQSPQEFKDIANWPAIRSAATTFWFMADPNMDESLYRHTFNLTGGQCEAIRSLIPKREAFLVQPELGVSKVILIDVEPEQRVLNTSHPREAAIRDRLIREHGFEEGMRQAVQVLEQGDAGQIGAAAQLRVVA